MSEQEPFKILSVKEYARLSTAEKRKYYSELANAFHLHHTDNELRRIWLDLKNARREKQ